MSRNLIGRNAQQACLCCLEMLFYCVNEENVRSFAVDAKLHSAVTTDEPLDSVVQTCRPVDCAVNLRQHIDVLSVVN